MLERQTQAFHDSPHMNRRFTLYNQSANVGYIDDGLRSKKPVNKFWAIIKPVEMFKTTWLLVLSSRNLVLPINGRDYFFIGRVIQPDSHRESFQRAVEQACKMARACKPHEFHCNANERW